MKTAIIFQLLLLVILLGGTIATYRKAVKCDKEEFICPDRQNCANICDGKKECDNGDDEDFCNTGIYGATALKNAILTGLRNLSTFKFLGKYYHDIFWDGKDVGKQNAKK